MRELDDLTGKNFGYLTVISRAEDRVTPSGQKRRMWLCRCQICGKEKAIDAQNLKRRRARSCGCLRTKDGRKLPHRKVCVVCGKEFECPPSSKKVTCSDECRSVYAKERTMGHAVSDSTKKKLSQAAKGRNMSGIQKIAVAASMESPKSGRFETNVNAIDWHLISPEGKEYRFHSLNNWLRENGERLFGCAPDTREYDNVRSGLSGAKRAMLGGSYPCCTYKGWRVIPTEDDAEKE